jgi:hypothetical protein
MKSPPQRLDSVLAKLVTCTQTLRAFSQAEIGPILSRVT